jgi:hypothetical protein
MDAFQHPFWSRFAQEENKTDAFCLFLFAQDD